jgi:hypothetical protein
LALASTTPLPYTRASTYPHRLTINIHTVALSLFLSFSRSYTQETDFYHVLNELLRGSDRTKIEPYKPYALQYAPSAQPDRFPPAPADT